MPQSARATFKLRKITRGRAQWPEFQCLNRHEQPSSTSSPPEASGKSRRFQCLNRHEQPSSSAKAAGQTLGGQRFNASIGTSNLQATTVIPPLCQYCSFNASIGTSNLQAVTRQRPNCIYLKFQCLNRHEQPSSSNLKMY